MKDFFRIISVIILISIISCTHKSNDMGLFNKKISAIYWDSIKYTESGYPENSFAVFELTTPKGEYSTGWINNGYKKYKYKEFCPFNITLHVDLTDSIAEKNPSLDMGTIEDYFTDNIKRICVVHIVYRHATEKGMDIELYVEKGVETEKYLNELQVNINRLVSFTFELRNDPKWRNFNRLL